MSEGIHVKTLLLPK